jgi:hypothetical protein
MQCPSCHAVVAEGIEECPSCGVIFAKWRGVRPRTASGTQAVPAVKPEVQAAKTGSKLPVFIIILLVVVGGAILSIGYFAFRGASEIGLVSGIGESKNRLRRLDSTNAHYDVVYQLPGSPQGIATNGRELMIGNRRDPWGAIRVRRDGRTFKADPVPIIEPVYNQKMNVTTLTWNGTNYVGYTRAAWFEQAKEGNVFTIHDPETMRVLRRHPAPDVGCIAWDGTGYWASSRRNTRDADEPAILYRLDRNFEIVARHEPPAVGCQGLAWDGKYLWFADVFDDGIFVLDVSGGTPKVVHREYSGMEYLSGVVFFERQIWITEYDDDRLHRIKPATRMAWTGEAPAEILASAVQTAPVEGSEEDLAKLREDLRSDDSSVRLHAEMELDRRGAPVDYDRDRNSFAKRPPDDAEVTDWSIELRGDGLYGDWSFWFGPDVLVKREQTSSIVTIPQFARYTITVRRPDGSEIEKEFEAVAGENVMNDVLLDDARASGEYRVSVFIHVQYVTAEGTARILNNSSTSLEVRR